MKYTYIPYTETTVVVMANGREVGICAEDKVEEFIKSLQK